MATPNPTNAHPTLGAHFIAGDTYNPMGASDPRIPRGLGPLPSVHRGADPSHLTYCRSPTQPPPLLPPPCMLRCAGSVQFSSVAQLCPTLCDPMDCSTPGFPVHPNSWSLLKLMSIESVMPSNHLILRHPFLLSPSIFPSIRVFSQ